MLFAESGLCGPSMLLKKRPFRPADLDASPHGRSVNREAQATGWLLWSLWLVWFNQTDQSRVMGLLVLSHYATVAARFTVAGLLHLPFFHPISFETLYILTRISRFEGLRFDVRGYSLQL